MERRTKKRLIYGSIYFAILLLITGGIYLAFFNPKPSCFDKIQNQGEERIDCGGPCRQLCVVKPVELIGKANVFSVDPTHSSILARIRNINLDIAVQRFSYEFRVYAGEEILLQSLEGESFIYAHEVKYLLVPGVEYPVEKISRIDFVVRSFELAPPERFFRPNVSIQDSKTTIIPPRAEVIGSVVNQDTVALSKVQVMAVFTGRFGQAAGASFTELDNVAAGEKRAFTILYPFIEDLDASRTELFIFAYRP